MTRKALIEYTPPPGRHFELFHSHRNANNYRQKQESPADARVKSDSSVIPTWPSAAILDIIEREIAPFDLPTPKTLA